MHTWCPTGGVSVSTDLGKLEFLVAPRLPFGSIYTSSYNGPNRDSLPEHEFVLALTA